MQLNPATEDFPFPTMPVTADKIVALTESLIAVNLSYGLGAKIEPLSLQASELVANGIGAVDCSGFTRWALFHALGQPADFGYPDGSVQQHEWIAAQGFKVSSVADGGDNDGVVRVFFLTPEASGEGVGHTGLIVDGSTCESHGHHGPDRRDWGSEGWMAKCEVYVLALP
jgi:hypothetical protein